MNNIWAETLYDAYGQSFAIDKVHFESKTEHQHLMIFQNAMFGRVMVLDGIVQTTEKDEFIYHEMLSHVPVLAHGNVKRVLIIGGGDGGILREICKHRTITSVTQVEIDQAVIDMSKEFLPQHSAGAFDDARVNIVIADGYHFVNHCNEKYDIIITDSTDPIGPGASLFTQEFYRACKNCLHENGILVTQNGVPFFQIDEMLSSAQKFSELFNDWAFYSAAVPTYVGGIMAFGWASDNTSARNISSEKIQQRFTAADIATRYYNADIHHAAFALPQYLKTQLETV